MHTKPLLQLGRVFAAKCRETAYSTVTRCSMLLRWLDRVCLRLASLGTSGLHVVLRHFYIKVWKADCRFYEVDSCVWTSEWQIIWQTATGKLGWHRAATNWAEGRTRP